MPVFHMNLRAAETRNHGRPDAITFGAADAATAAAIAAIVDAAVDSKQVSLTQRVASDNLNTDHPAGTHTSIWVVSADATDAICKYRLRNLKGGADADAIRAAVPRLFTNDFNAADLLLGLQALGVTPKQPNSGTAIVRASVAFTPR